MLKKLTMALTLTAATASAEVTMEDQGYLNLLGGLIVVGEFCGFDLTAGANALIDERFAYLGSKYSEAAIYAAFVVSEGIIREKHNAAATDEAWCAGNLALGPLFWSEPN